MEFHQLRYFVAAAKEMSMSRAAERVHVSQPAPRRHFAGVVSKNVSRQNLWHSITACWLVNTL